MPPKHTVRAAICISMLSTVVACGKQAEAPATAMESTPKPAQVMADMAAPPPPPAAKAAGQLSMLEQKKPSISSDLVEAGTGITNAGIDRTAQLTSSATSYTDNERKFIRTANMNFRVKDVYLSANAIEDVVATTGGFVIQNNISSQVRDTQVHPIGNGKLMQIAEYTVQGDLIVRVPSQKTQEFLRAVANQITFLDQRNFSAHDAQFDMLRKQLEYARNEETQQEQGQSIRDGGKLEQRTEAINARNDSKAARDEARVQKKEFDDQVAFSTINFKIYQLPDVTETEIKDIDAVFRQNRPGFLHRLGDACTAGWDRTLDLTITAVEWWPFWFIIAIIAVVIRRLGQRKRAVATTKT
jgi:hypothetical protein